MLEEFDKRHGAGLTRRRHRRDDLQERCRSEVQGRDRVGLRRPARRRPGHDRRLQAHHRGSRQPRPGRAAAVSDNIVERGNKTDGLARAVQQLPRQHALALSRHRPHQVHGPGRRRSATSSTRCRSTWAPTTSTTSTSSAAPGRSTCRPTRSSATKSTDIRQLQVRNNQGQMVRLGTLLDVRDTSGPVMVHALQHVLGRRHHRQRRARAPAPARPST